MPKTNVPKAGVPSVESILNAVIDAIVTIDGDGVIQSVNPAVEKIFGYSPEELTGRNVSVLMPDPYRSEHDRYLRDYLRTGRAKIIGIGREVVAKKKDGTVFPIYLGVSEGGKKGARRFFTGVIRDVTEVKRFQDDLKRQNEFTVAVLDTVQSLVMVLDRHGRVTNLNRACEETTGYTLREASGKYFWDLFLAPEDKDAAVRHFLVSGPKQFPSHFESPWRTKDGKKRLVAWSNSGLFDRKGSLEFVIGTGVDITERRELERMVLEITRREQQRIGQELHDGLAQHLTSTALSAKVLEKKLSGASSQVFKEAKRVVGLINQAVAQTRQLAQGLYALETLPDDLFSSLKKLAHDTGKTAQVHCVFEADAAGLSVSEEAAAHLYRIAREAVNNAVKHGHGRNIWIRLGKKGGRSAELSVENDGRVFPKNAAGRKGLGMHIMRSRAALLNASLTVEARPKGGAVVRCVLPVCP